jgi:hypothetical protein
LGSSLLRILLCCTFRADFIGCLAELAANFFIKNFVAPRCAITFDNFTGAHIGMAFRRFVTDTDSYISMERANGYRAGGYQRISNSRSEIVGPVFDGHKGPPAAN